VRVLSRTRYPGVLIGSSHRAAPARRGAFADERRVVAATSAVAKRSAIASGSTTPPTELKLIGCSSHRRTHRHLSSRCARALRRVRRSAAHRCRRRKASGVSRSVRVPGGVVRRGRSRCGVLGGRHRWLPAGCVGGRADHRSSDHRRIEVPAGRSFREAGLKPMARSLYRACPSRNARALRRVRR
jgi:hypothetical protein